MPPECDKAGVLINPPTRHSLGAPECETEFDFMQSINNCSCEPGNREATAMDQSKLDYDLWRYPIRAGSWPHRGHPSPY